MPSHLPPSITIFTLQSSRIPFTCLLPHHKLRNTNHHRHLSTTNTDLSSLANEASQADPDNARAPPRWARTPPQMRAPARTRPKSDNDTFAVNESAAVLDAALARTLGAEGESFLPESVRWLAVTHKSFDHGRRGFNDRLAYLGKRIAELQVCQALLDAPRAAYEMAGEESLGREDKYGRVPFTHPALEGLSGVTAHAKAEALDRKRLARLAERYGLEKVVRWKPRLVRDLQSSGIDTVLAHTLYAIVGAVALQKGGEFAGRTVRQRILRPLGLL